jgi:NAD(P)H-dependent FMN reductase
MTQPVLNIIIGSTRPGRVGKPVADWLHGEAKAHGGFEVELTDLADLDLPLLNEPNHPKLGKYTHEKTKTWSTIVARADAVVFVTPEYNQSYNAALKNAIDYLNAEWSHKPAGIVSYGGVSAGTRAAAALRVVLAAVGMIVIQPAVHIPFVANFLDEDRTLVPNTEMGVGAKTMLDELARVTTASAALRRPAARGSIS